MISIGRRLLVLLVLLVLVVAAPLSWATPATAQGTSTTASDSVFARAQRLVAEGQGDAARKLVQSQLEVAPTGSPRYVDALYWRAVLAANPSESERDLRRLVIDFPLAPRAADALLRLGQLEFARGDRQQAITHLDRLVREHAESALRPRASYWMARAWFDEGSVPTGCAKLADATRASPSDSIELRNQIAFYAQRCAGVDTTVQAVVTTRKPGQGGVVIAGSTPRPAVSARSSRTPPPIARSLPPIRPSARDSAASAASVAAANIAAANAAAIRRDSVTNAAPRIGDSVSARVPARNVVTTGVPARDTVGTRVPARDTISTRPPVRAPIGTRPPARDTVGTQPQRVAPTETVQIPPNRADSARPPETATSTPAIQLNPATRIPPRPIPPTPAPVVPTPVAATPPVVAHTNQWTVQVGAYKTRAEAEDLRKRVVAGGFEPRIWENSGYFKVRVGRYASHAAADAASSAIQKKKLAVYVTEAEPK